MKLLRLRVGKARARKSLVWGLIAFSVICLVSAVREWAVPEFARDAMCMAAYDGNIGEMRWLLFLGASPSAVGWEEHFTPLGEVARSGNEDAARFLLAPKANIFCKDDFHKTALQEAQAYDHSNVACLLEQAERDASAKMRKP